MQQRPARENGLDAVYVLSEALHADLKLTAEQEPAWVSFLRKLDAMRNDAARERVTGRREALGIQTLPKLHFQTAAEPIAEFIVGPVMSTCQENNFTTESA